MKTTIWKLPPKGRATLVRMRARNALLALVTGILVAGVFALQLTNTAHAQIAQDAQQQSTTIQVHPLGTVVGTRLAAFVVNNNTVFFKSSDDDGVIWSPLTPLGNPGFPIIDSPSLVSDAPGGLQVFVM